MGKAKIIGICLVVGIVAVGAIACLVGNNYFFSTGGRYDDSVF